MAVHINNDAYASTAGIPTGDFTITCWANATTLKNPGGVVTYDDGSDLQRYSIQLRPDWQLRSQALSYSSGITPAAGDWWKLGFVFSGSTGTFYGAEASAPLAVLCSGALTTTTPGRINIGGTPTGAQSWDGRLAAVKAWSVAFTAGQVETELTQYLPVITAGLLRYHPFIVAELTDYSGFGRTLSSGVGAVTADAPPLKWGTSSHSRISFTPLLPTVDAGKDVFGTAGFEFSIQAVETGGMGITSRSWTVVSGPAEVATEIGTTSLLSWFPATAGVYELEYRVTNAAGQAYDTVYATVNATGTIVSAASVSGTTTTLTCGKPTGTAQGDVMLATQSGDFNDLDLMAPPAGWQPLFEYDVGLDSLHVKGWTLTAGASEPATYDFAQGAGSAGVVTIVAMRGVVEAGVRLAIVPDTGTTATRTSPTVEGAVPGSILLCGAMTSPAAARTWTPPTGMTEQSDAQSGTAVTHSVASLLNPADPTGTQDFTLSGTTVAPGGIQWSAVFPMPADPQRRGANKSMFTVVRTT